MTTVPLLLEQFCAAIDTWLNADAGRFAEHWLVGPIPFLAYPQSVKGNLEPAARQKLAAILRLSARDHGQRASHLGVDADTVSNLMLALGNEPAEPFTESAFRPGLSARPAYAAFQQLFSGGDAQFTRHSWLTVQRIVAYVRGQSPDPPFHTHAPVLLYHQATQKRAVATLDIDRCSSLSGESTGGIFACGMPAGARAKQLDHRVAVSIKLALRVGNPQQASDVLVEAVSQDSVISKLQATTDTRRIRHVVSQRNQRETLAASDIPDNVTVHGFVTLAQVFNRLQGEPDVEKVLDTLF